MRRRQVLMFLAGAAAVWSAGPLAAPGAASARAVPAGAVRAAALWGRAIEVPGLGALNKGNVGIDVSVSCASPGNCAAAGTYHNHGDQGFAAVERHGRWRRAIEIPGLAALNTGGDFSLDSVSCGSAGNCATGGYYTDRHQNQQGFVVSEKNGRWGKAIEAPGLAGLNKGRDAAVNGVSCGSVGSCVAGGLYRDQHGHFRGFVAVERNGRWDRAIEVPGLAALNTSTYGGAGVDSVSCTTTGNCTVGGGYWDSAGDQVFVVSEKNGRWGRAIAVPGLEALNAGGIAYVSSVSCATAGNCAAGGYYTDSSDNDQGFVVSEKNGVWGQAIEVPGMGKLNPGGEAQVVSVSCATAGNCAAGGTYTDSAAFPNGWGFVASEKNGVWGKAINVPGLGGRPRGRYYDVNSVSCAPPGSCAAGGDYQTRAGYEGYVVSEKNGRWGRAIEVPGLAALNKGADAGVNSVSCATAGSCAASGSFADRHRRQQGYVSVSSVAGRGAG